MPRVWSLCDVALVHLKDDPLFAGVIPSKIFEAMASGLPVLLAAPAGEASGIIENSGAGLTVPPEDPAALADAVINLSDDAGKLRALAEKSLAAAPVHSRKAQARHMIEVLALAQDRRGAEAASFVLSNPGPS
jgi:glycosyltransferase involved in cell wall biosynthesis